MRSQDDLHRLFYGDPSEPGYPRRLTPYQMEQLARAQRALMLGEMLAAGIVGVARFARRLFGFSAPRRAVPVVFRG